MGVREGLAAKMIGALRRVRFETRQGTGWGHVIDDRTKNIRQNQNEVEDYILLVGKVLMYLETLRASISARPLHPVSLRWGFMEPRYQISLCILGGL